MADRKNPCLKKRDIENPYEIWKSEALGMEWRVLKKYQLPEKEENNPRARWFCAVKSPFTFDQWEYEDAFVADIVDNARAVRVYRDSKIVDLVEDSEE
jgi:hypothetical protein